MIDRLLTISELAKRLGRSFAWVSRRVRKGSLPYILSDGRYYFRESSIEAWLAAGEHKPTSMEARPAAPRKTVEQEAAEWGLSPDELLH